MIVAKAARNSYAAGEISRTLWQFDELARQQIGAKRIENLIVLLEGGLTRAPGTRFVAALPNQAQKGKLLPFRYNDANAYDLIFNNGKMRVKKDGGIVESSPGTPFDLTVPYAEADLENIRAARDADVMFVACSGKKPQELKRLGHANWTIADHLPAGGPVKDMNTDTGKTIQASANSGSITLTANNSRFAAGDVGGVFRLDEPDLLSVPLWKANEDILSASTKITSVTPFGDTVSPGAAHDGVRTKAFSACSRTSSSTAINAYNGTDFGTGAAIAYVDFFGSADAGFFGSAGLSNITVKLFAKNSSPANGTDGVELGSITFDEKTNESVGPRRIFSNDNTTAYRYAWIYFSANGGGDQIGVAQIEFYKWNTPRVPAQRRYNGNVYEAITDGNTGPNPPTHDEGDQPSGSSNIVWRFLHKGYGYVRIDTYTDATHANGTVLSRLPDSVVSKATTRWWAPAWTADEGYPTRIVLHQNRLWWFRGNYFWATRVGDFWDHEPELANGVLTADSPISGRIRSNDGSVVDVEWALASGQLVIGMVDGEWILRPGTSATAAVTAENVNLINDDNEGSAKQIPAQVKGGVLFIGKSRKRLHMATFDRLADKIGIDEVTQSARHILKGLAQRVVFQRDPNKLAWIQCMDGSLIAFTFMPAQQVAGFTRRPFINGIVEDLNVTPKADGTADVVTLIIRRTINGQTKRYIEEFAPFFEPLDDEAPTAEGAWFLDCALQYDGAPATTFSGLDHLEGETVSIFADGAMREQKVVSGGAVTIADPASKAVIGIPQHWYLRCLSFDPNKADGSSKPDYKRTPEVLLQYVDCAGGEIRTNAGKEEADRAQAQWEPLFETGGKDYGAPLTLFTGREAIEVESDADFELDIELRGTDACPFTFAGMVPAVQISAG